MAIAEITIRSVTGGETSVKRYTGELIKEDGGYIAVYEYTEDGEEYRVTTTVSGDGFTVSVRGGYEAEYVYGTDKTHECELKTAYGTIPVSLKTEALAIKIKDDGIFLKADYVASVAGERSRRGIIITIRRKKL
ncbi:MAG: DUF1934 domain-containing protein [Clostridia bacterium]|nr:DUF1934 domain-containing protein [Clostridia bacterium]